MGRHLIESERTSKRAARCFRELQVHELQTMSRANLSARLAFTSLINLAKNKLVLNSGFCNLKGKHVARVFWRLVHYRHRKVYRSLSRRYDEVCRNSIYRLLSLEISFARYTTKRTLLDISFSSLLQLLLVHSRTRELVLCFVGHQI